MITCIKSKWFTQIEKDDNLEDHFDDIIDELNCEYECEDGNINVHSEQYKQNHSKTLKQKLGTLM